MGRTVEFDTIKHTVMSHLKPDEQVDEITKDMKKRSKEESDWLIILQNKLNKTVNQTPKRVQNTHTRAKTCCQFALKATTLTPQEVAEVMMDDEKQTGPKGLACYLARHMA